jgi:putative glycosyltransferase (TIGR04372 family)
MNNTKDSPEISWDVAMKVFNELALWGNYVVGENILLTIRSGIESSHPNKIWSERGLYFSAIGHQSQLHWLIECLSYSKSVHLAELVDGYLTPASKILAGKWVRVAHDSGITVNQIESDKKLSYLDLETFPTGNGFELIRRRIGEAHHQLKLTNRNTFLALTENEVSQAEAILSRFGFQPSDSCRLVGLHVRTGSDFLREGRNSTIGKYKGLVRKITDHGDWVIAIGDQSQGEIFRDFENNGMNFINFAVRDSHERELVHLYVWAKSRFMVGNLSGGTMPATAFNTPILWIDFYPLRHFRPPNEFDLVVPKRIVDTNEKKNITFDQLFSEFGNYYDSENILLLHSRGFQLVETDETDILSGVEEMYCRTAGDESLVSDVYIDNYINELYKSVNLAYGASWSKAFISRHSTFFSHLD